MSFLFFFFKQKTAYEMRISDWSSDVCSSDLLGVARDLPRRRLLLLDGAGDGGGDLVDLADGLGDGADGAHRVAGGRLDAGNLVADVLGRLGGLHGERLHLAGHHGEALAGLAGARRLDGRVERQPGGLLGDRKGTRLKSSP